MARFKWTAKDAQGRKQSGEIEAKTVSHARMELRERGYREVQASILASSNLFGLGSDPQKEKIKKRSEQRRRRRQQEAAKQRKARLDRSPSVRKKADKKKSGLDIEITWGPFGDIPEKDLMVFCKKLATMVRSGLPLIDALTLANDQSKANMKRVSGEILDDVNAGQSLSQAMSKQDRHFDNIYLNLIEAGEISGNLDTFLDRMVFMMERQKEIKSGIKSALFYPITLIVVTLGITIFMLTNVVPIFQELFEGLGGELPGPTQMLVDISEFLLSGGLLYLAGWVIGFFVLNSFLTKASRPFARFKAGLWLKLPLFGDIILKAAIARIALLMANLFAAGVSIVEILRIAENASNNILFQEAMERIKEEVTSGTALSLLFAEESVFPAELGQLIKVGEETGNIEEMLSSIAKYYQEEFDAVVEGLSTVIEPLMIVIVGAVVGGLIMALYLPIFQAGDLVKG